MGVAGSSGAGTLGDEWELVGSEPLRVEEEEDANVDVEAEVDGGGTAFDALVRGPSPVRLELAIEGDTVEIIDRSASSSSSTDTSSILFQTRNMRVLVKNI